MIHRGKLFLVIWYMLIIFSISSIPHLKEPYIPFDPTKFSLHFLEYLVLGIFLSDLTRSRAIDTSIGAVYGITDEIHQYFVPGRFCDPLDALADFLGVLVGVYLAPKIKSYLIKNIKCVIKF